MKKIKRRLSQGSRFVLAVIVAVAGLAAWPQKTTAACTAPQTNYGSATVSLPINTGGEYRMWSRMMPSSNGDSFLLELDGNQCFIVGDAALDPSKWTWVDYQGGNQNTKLTTYLNAGVHTLKLIGREPGVKVDRILALQNQSCVPVNFGDNCTDTQEPSLTITNPANAAVVSGTVTASANVSDNIGIGRVEFYVKDNLKATVTAAPYEYKWDVAALPNGSYSLKAIVYDIAGNSTTETVSVTVRNGDTQPPTAPTGLSVQATQNSVSLKWQASQDNTGVTGYWISRNGTVIVNNLTALAYTDANVAPGSTYTYRVGAFDAAGNRSGLSDAATATTPALPTADTQPPTTPSGVTAQAISKSQINVAWTPSTDNVSVAAYDLYRASSTETATKIASVKTTSFGDNSLTSNTKYTYYVVARDAGGNTSQQSVQVTATTFSAKKTTAKLKGVVQGRNGRPLVGARVTLWADGKQYSASTNWRGKYVITRIPEGTYEVKYRAHNYQRQNVELDFIGGQIKWWDVQLSR